MNTITLYKNGHPYPYYGNITSYKTVQATPRNQDIQSGYIDMTLTADDIFQFNYLSFKRSGITVYGWVENAEDLSGNTRWRIHYKTDAFRTYRQYLNLGTQYVERASDTETKLRDPLLSSTQEHKDTNISRYYIGGEEHFYRWDVLQERVEHTETYSPNGAQPSPYKLLFAKYDIRNWTTSNPITSLLRTLAGSSESSRFATMYSIPYVDTSNMTLRTGEGPTAGWYFMPYDSTPDARGPFTTKTPIDFPDNLTKTGHSVVLVFPEAGVMNIPDEFLHRDDLAIRQDIDPFSGACNYMLAINNGLTPTYLSVRGSSMTSIPILSNPYETYLSQNQNALTVGLLGDVAAMAGGVATGNPVMAGAGLGSFLKKQIDLQDQKSATPSNPPAFLGSALMHHFNQQFFRIITKAPYDNEAEVRARYGYPIQKIMPLTIPQTGFIQTSGRSVSSNGIVPLWAIKEINQLFDAGILFR